MILHYRRILNIEDKGGKAVITVRDTGIGIPVEDQAHVFERFYRADKAAAK